MRPPSIGPPGPDVRRYTPTMERMEPSPGRPDLGVPPRPDLGWLSLPPVVFTPKPRRGVRVIVALITIVALLGSVGVLVGAGSDLSRPRGTTDEYKFLAMVGGKPVRWNPCEPIHYVA